MTQIRRPLLGLVALFVGAVTIDRLGDAALASWVFLLGAGAVALPLIAGGIRRGRSWTALLPAIGAYTIAKALAPGGPTSTVFDAYVATTEVAFLALAALLAQRLASAVEDLDETLGTVAFGESPALPLEGPQATNEILSEMARSRRHNRPLSVTVLAPHPESLELAVDRVAEDVRETIRARYVKGRLARVIGEQLRRSDLLFEDPHTGRFVILSPETGDEGTQLLAARVTQAARDLKLELEVGSASFPDHAISFEQLVEVAELRLAGGDLESMPQLRAVEGTDGGTG
jgi:hypothetical protein